MNAKSLNRAIGLAMSALQQARANGYSSQVITHIRHAVLLLNKARTLLKRGDEYTAKLHAACAYDMVNMALSYR